MCDNVDHNKIQNKINRICDITLMILCVFFAEQLLLNSSVVNHAVGASLELCINTVIPSLFCFMVLTAFVSSSKLGSWLCIPMLPLCRLLCIPVNCGSIMLLSLIGGYPSGAKALADAWKQKVISESVLRRMILFVVCPAPSFVVITLGSYYFHNQSVGWLLYVSQVLSVLFIAFITSFSAPVQNKQHLSKSMFRDKRSTYSHALVEAVTFSSSALLNMCGYIILFGVITSLVAQFHLSEEILAVISAILEICSACEKLTALTVPYRMCLLSFFLSFGGLSVQFQLKSILRECPCSFPRILIGRIVQGFCSAVFTHLMLRCFPQVVHVFSADSMISPIKDSSTPIMSLCLIGMLMILLTDFERKTKDKIKR